MRTINKDTLQSRMEALSVTNAKIDVPTLIGAGITNIQQQLPYAGLFATTLLPYIGDALLTGIEQLQAGTNAALTTCYETIISDIEACASKIDVDIPPRDETGKKLTPIWTSCKRNIKKCVTTVFSDFPKDHIVTKKRTGYLPVEYEQAKQKQKEHATAKDALLDNIITHAEKQYSAMDKRTDYIIVKNPTEYRGIYRVTNKRITMMTDCYIEVVKLTTPILTSNSSEYSRDLYILDRKDKEHKITVTSQHQLDGTFVSKFKAIGAYPTTKTNQQYFDEILDTLSREPTVIQQQQTDTLGWHMTAENKRVFVLTNGCETVDGFLEGDKAPFQAPFLGDDINGYKGASVSAPSDEVMHLLLEQLNPQVTYIQAAMLGQAAYVMFPNTIYDGTLDFALEIIGQSRRGKTAMINYFLSLFGVAFRYENPTLLNTGSGLGKGDTLLGELGLISMFKYVLYTDADYKVENDKILDEKLKQRRDAINVMLADKASGGVTSSRNGKLRFRGSPHGAMIRQGNQDYAMKNPDEVLEGRVTTLLWPDEAYSSYDISYLIGVTHRPNIYSWGVAYRTQWIATKTDEELQKIFYTAHDTAYELIQQYTWYRDLHKKHAHVLVTGLMLWRAFLMEQYPSSFMINWIDVNVTELLDKLVARNKFIYEDVQQNAKTVKTDTIIDAIRAILHKKDGYISSQSNEELSIKDNLPVPLEYLGYYKRQGGKYVSKNTLIGHIHTNRDNHMCIAFITKALYSHIEKYLKEHDVHIDKTAMLKLLADNQLIDTDMPNYEVRVTIAKKRSRYMVMPFEVLFPVCDEGDVNNPQDEDLPQPGDKDVPYLPDERSKRKGDTSHLSDEDVAIQVPD